MNLVTPVVLCGGSGTRLWPLSRKSFPKQFVALVGDKSLLQLTLERVEQLGPTVMAVASEEHRLLVAGAMRAARLGGTVILEPVARNTAAAMALAALRASPDSLLLFCPADHHIPDPIAFGDTIDRGLAAAHAGSIVLFGVVPSFPSTAYGYIDPGAPRDDGSRAVAGFIEKPDTQGARQLLLKPGVLWNAGIMLVRASRLLQALRTHAPDILQACEAANADAAVDDMSTSGREITFVIPQRAALQACRPESIDRAVTEIDPGICVVPFQGQWSDVGSWNEVAALNPPDTEGNRVQGQGIVHECTGTFVHAPHRPVVALGTRDLLVIDTPDAVLVVHRDFAEKVKDVVGRLVESHSAQALAHRRVERPWGWYDSIHVAGRFQVKRIGVRPGGSLSLQLHHHRAEHWVVVGGTAQVTRGTETFLLCENESTYIPIGQVHRLHNPGLMELEMIEVQSGSYLGEDDIVRLEDAYGRAA